MAKKNVFAQKYDEIRRLDGTAVLLVIFEDITLKVLPIEMDPAEKLGSEKRGAKIFRKVRLQSFEIP